jgi:O-antigen/teichoic acid export membrane protein
MNQKNQTNRNFIFNIVSLGINIGIGLFYTPYLVRNLGIVAYGIVPLALIINQYISVITGSLTGSLTRFYTVAVQKDKTQEASKYLSSSFIAITVIIGILSPVFILLILNIESVFNIPILLIKQSKQLFIFTIFGFVISLYTSLLNISLYSQNRLDLINLIKILRSAIAIFLTVLFFEQISKDVSFIGYSTFIAELGVLLLSIYYFNKTTTSKVKLSIKNYEKTALISVFSMSVWVMIHQVGDTGLYRIDNILVNKFWSTRESGILGAVTQFGTYVMLTTSVLSTLFGPLILIAYSNNDHDKVKALALNNSFLIGLLTAIMVGLLSGFSKPILSLWLGEEFEVYYKWFILKQITLPFYAAAGVFAFVYRAWNKVIMPAIVTLLIGSINLATSYFICTISDGSEDYIVILLIAASLFIVVQSFGLNSYSFIKTYPEVAKTKILLIFFKILVTLASTSLLAFFYTYNIQVENILQLIIGFSLVGIFVISSGYFVLLDSQQKQLIINFVYYFTKKRRNY